ncbi:MAG: hypothetical protein GX879_07860 [Bacteroidales bacterium]|nr:hypothetical protein [Bacteroidales bacterium]
MSKTKIENIQLKGFRGAKDQLDIPLNGKSIVLYGENGTERVVFQMP